MECTLDTSIGLPSFTPQKKVSNRAHHFATAGIRIMTTTSTSENQRMVTMKFVQIPKFRTVGNLGLYSRVCWKIVRVQWVHPWGKLQMGQDSHDINTIPDSKVGRILEVSVLVVKADQNATSRWNHHRNLIANSDANFLKYLCWIP